MASETDVVVVGAGLAGATAAQQLAQRGFSVVLVDKRAQCPVCFKAEKIEPDQADLFRKFGLMPTLLPFTGAIRTIRRASGRRVLRTVEIEQYGIFYHDMVNAIRGVLPPQVDTKIGGVTQVVPSHDRQMVTLASGETISARLVVLAGGTGSDFHGRLGFERHTLAPDHSVAFGFTVERQDGRPFDFDSVTYYPADVSTGIAFLTLFRLGATMRANFFVYWPNSSDDTRQFVRNPDRELASRLPGLRYVAGDLKVVGRVDSARIDLYRITPPTLPGVVVIADAAQSVCPTTGSGLSKVLTDVDLLCNEFVPQWLSGGRIEPAAIAAFYEHPHKQAVDRKSLGGAFYTKRLWTDTSLGWRLRRLQWQLDNQLAELPGFRFTRKLTA